MLSGWTLSEASSERFRLSGDSVEEEEDDDDDDVIVVVIVDDDDDEVVGMGCGGGKLLSHSFR